MEKIKKLKAHIAKIIYIIFGITAIFILFKSGAVYVNISGLSITFGIDLDRKDAYMPLVLDKQIQVNKDAIRRTDLLIEDARRRGILVD